MAESTTKVFTITGDAAAAMGGTRRRRKSTAAKDTTMKVGKEQKGGTSPGTSLQIEANRAPGGAEPPPANFAKSTGSEIAKISTESTPAPVAAVQVAGAKPVKVILEKNKKATKVVLAPTKIRKLHPVSSTSSVKTRKVAKKIRMSLNGFGKRVTRANTIRNEAKKQTIGDIKKTLVEAKLVKADSKAPETVLRQIYADFMTLKNRAL